MELELLTDLIEAFGQSTDGLQTHANLKRLILKHWNAKKEPQT